MNSKGVGLSNEAYILAKLTSIGWVVSIPFGDNAPYDLIADTGKELIRIQCRTPRFRNSRFRIKLTSVRINRKGKRIKELDRQNIDAIASYVRETGDVYLVRVSEILTNHSYILTDPCKVGAVMEW